MIQNKIILFLLLLLPPSEGNPTVPFPPPPPPPPIIKYSSDFTPSGIVNDVSPGSENIIVTVLGGGGGGMGGIGIFLFSLVNGGIQHLTSLEQCRLFVIYYKELFL